MIVYKFGGAAVATPENVTKLLPIIHDAEPPLAIVVSAIGKTTNLLEQIVKSAIDGDNQTKLHIESFKNNHIQFAQSLLNGLFLDETLDKLGIYFEELNWALDDIHIQKDDYVYDQIVCLGELCSTTIIAAYLSQSGINNKWVDARDLIRTNDYYRSATVDEAVTASQIDTKLKPILNTIGIVVTQGFIGATDENNSTTLGREGSDYTAALLGAFLGASAVTIWKDVPGFLNADPRKYENTIRIPKLSFHEVIELTYYGAQVIHPKTIKPLYNHNIPLYVKCFEDASLPGSVIQANDEHIDYPPLIVQKSDQLLLDIRTEDYSFITRHHLTNIYEVCETHIVKINMMQNAATSLQICIDAQHFAKETLIAILKQSFIVLRNENMNILTVRHYQQDMLLPLLEGKEIIIEQKTRTTYQCIYRKHS